MEEHRDFIDDAVRKALDEKPEKIRETGEGRAHQTAFIETDSGDYVLKFCKGEGLERFEVEAEVIKLVKHRTDVPVPNIEYSDLSSSRYPFFVAEKVPGISVNPWNGDQNFKSFSRERKSSLLTNMAEILGRLHSQTSFDSFAHLEYNEGLQNHGSKSWSEVLEEVIMEEQIQGMRGGRFDEMIPQIEQKLKENIEIVDTSSDPVLVHQDYRWSNVLVKENDINAVIDWERALVGHREYDFFKLENTLCDHFRTQELKDWVRDKVYTGYFNHVELENGWRKRRNFYRFIYSIEPLWTFDDWSQNLDSEVTERLASQKRNEMKERMAEL